jgi:hypothetical protein
MGAGLELRPYSLQLVIVGPRRFALDSHLFGGTHNPPYRVPLQTGGSRNGTNLLAG